MVGSSVGAFSGMDGWKETLRGLFAGAGRVCVFGSFTVSSGIMCGRLGETGSGAGFGAGVGVMGTACV